MYGRVARGHEVDDDGGKVDTQLLVITLGGEFGGNELLGKDGG